MIVCQDITGASGAETFYVNWTNGTTCTSECLTSVHEMTKTSASEGRGHGVINNIGFSVGWKMIAYQPAVEDIVAPVCRQPPRVVL